MARYKPEKIKMGIAIKMEANTGTMRVAEKGMNSPRRR